MRAIAFERLTYNMNERLNYNMNDHIQIRMHTFDGRIRMRLFGVSSMFVEYLLTLCLIGDL